MNPDPDPSFQVNPDLIRIQCFDDQKLKKNTWNFFLFWSKVAIYLSLGQATGEAFRLLKRTSSTGT